MDHAVDCRGSRCILTFPGLANCSFFFLFAPVQPHVLMKFTSANTNNNNNTAGEYQGYAFRGGLDLWAMLFFHDPATGPEELETFGRRLIARDILVNYTPHIQGTYVNNRIMADPSLLIMMMTMIIVACSHPL